MNSDFERSRLDHYIILIPTYYGYFTNSYIAIYYIVKFIYLLVIL